VGEASGCVFVVGEAGLVATAVVGWLSTGRARVGLGCDEVACWITGVAFGLQAVRSWSAANPLIPARTVSRNSRRDILDIQVISFLS
jgi:hypothetical protein